MARRGTIVVLAALAPLLAGCGGMASLSGLGGGVPAPVTGPIEGSVPIAAAPSIAAPAPAPVVAAPLIPLGAALGGVLGGPVGASMSEADRTSAWDAQIAALDSGQRKSWRGANGVFGFVEAGPEAGAGCRSYNQTNLCERTPE